MGSQTRPEKIELTCQPATERQTVAGCRCSLPAAEQAAEMAPHWPGWMHSSTRGIVVADAPLGVAEALPILREAIARYNREGEMLVAGSAIPWIARPHQA